MKAIYLVPGSGGSFYCQNCVRDLALVKALRSQGADALSIPLYLPVSGSENANGNTPPVFYGAIQLYLGHAYPGLNRLIRTSGRLLNAPWLLKWAARKGGTTSARELESLTLSMLHGENGRQARELDELVTWLESEGKPDVVHLSNALLLGMAKRLKERLRIPVVCSLQDEDHWIDAMSPEGAQAVWGLMSEKAADVDVFLAVSDYYAETMRKRMRLGADRVRVVSLGIELDGFEESSLSFDPPVIGYLSRLCESMGFGRLIDAFIQLKALPQFRKLRLHATGGSTPADESFLTGVRDKLARLHLEGDVEFIAEFDRPRRQKFLKSITVLSVPVPRGEAFGAFQIEALAAGVPLVQPRVGAYPEIIHQTGGGLLYDPENSDGLVTALRQLLSDPARAKALGRQGRQVVRERFGIERMASSTLQVYREVSAGRSSL